MKDYVDQGCQDVLAHAQLLDFDALWNLQLEAVDEPNTERGGWSSVSQLTVGNQAFYLKRQINHLTRSVSAPLGEPTFAREWRNIMRYQQKQIPALQAAYFAQRRVGHEQRAILLTYALTGWHDLDYYLQQWSDLPAATAEQIIIACAGLARTLHKAKQMHGCFYPKHVFLRAQNGYFDACFIDLEKTRPLWFASKDRIKDLEPLFRRAQYAWKTAQIKQFLAAYLDGKDDLDQWLQRIIKRRQYKETH